MGFLKLQIFFAFDRKSQEVWSFFSFHKIENISVMYDMFWHFIKIYYSFLVGNFIVVEVKCKDIYKHFLIGYCFLIFSTNIFEKLLTSRIHCLKYLGVSFFYVVTFITLKKMVYFSVYTWKINPFLLLNRIKFYETFI